MPRKRRTEPNTEGTEKGSDTAAEGGEVVKAAKAPPSPAKVTAPTHVSVYNIKTKADGNIPPNRKCTLTEEEAERYTSLNAVRLIGEGD